MDSQYPGRLGEIGLFPPASEQVRRKSDSCKMEKRKTNERFGKSVLRIVNEDAPGRDGEHDSVAGELSYEPVPEIGVIDFAGVQMECYRFTVHFSTSFSAISGPYRPEEGPRYAAIRGSRRANRIR